MKANQKKVAESAQATQVINAVVNEQVFNDVAENATKAKTAKQKAAQERRDWLRGISAQFQAKQELMELMGVEPIPTINEMLHEYYRKENEITELNTFDQWKKKGYSVRRGEKAYLFWGKPRRKETEELTDEAKEQGVTIENATPEQLKKTSSKDEYYPLCYLFDISQCHKQEQGTKSQEQRPNAVA